MIWGRLRRPDVLAGLSIVALLRHLCAVCGLDLPAQRDAHGA